MPSKKEETALVLAKEAAGMNIENMAQHLVRSGYFKDVNDPSKAVVKLLAGQELGVPPVASLMNIHVIEGKVTLSATMMAALVKKAGYKYVTEMTADCVTINFRDRDGTNLGTSTFSMKDAAAAGLAGKHNWKSYPKAMMFARAMSQGARWFCADVLAGAAYTPEEIAPDVRVNEDGEPVSPLPQGPSTVAADLMNATVKTVAKVEVIPAPEPTKKDKAIDKAMSAMNALGVETKTIEDYFTKQVGELNEQDLEDMRVLYADVKSGARGKDLKPAVPAAAEPDDIPEPVEQTDGELYATLQKVRAKDSRAFDRVLAALLGCKWEKFDSRSRDDFMTMLRSDHVQGMLKGAGVEK